jgi:hypothetical protein
MITRITFREAYKSWSIQHLGQKILLSILFSNTLNLLCSSLRMRKQISQSCKTIGEILVLCIFSLYVFREEKGRQTLNRMVAIVHRI